MCEDVVFGALDLSVSTADQFPVLRLLCN